MPDAADYSSLFLRSSCDTVEMSRHDATALVQGASLASILGMFLALRWYLQGVMLRSRDRCRVAMNFGKMLHGVSRGVHES